MGGRGTHYRWYRRGDIVGRGTAPRPLPLIDGTAVVTLSGAAGLPHLSPCLAGPFRKKNFFCELRTD